MLAGMERRQVQSSPIEVLSPDACFTLLASRSLGRLAFAVGAHAEIFPINYALEGHIIVFRTTPHIALGVAPGIILTFEVDDWDSKQGVGWSVIAKGQAEDITHDLGRSAEHLRRVPVHPVAPGERWRWLALLPYKVSGRRFEAYSIPARRAHDWLPSPPGHYQRA